MSIPKQVEEAARMAEELMASQNPTDEINESEEENLEPEEDVELQPEEDVEEEQDTEEDIEPDTQEPDEDESFKQKYLSLKGKYDSEVPRLNQELREFKEQVFSRLGEQKPVKEEPVSKQTPTLPQEAQKFIEEYGDDYATGLDAYMAYKLEQMLEGKIQPVQQRVDEFEDTQVKVAQENFASYLDEQVNGDWRALWNGADEGFVEFLSQPDPSGLYTNAELLKLYNDNWEADRMAKLLNSYIGEKEEPVAPQPKKKPPVEDSRVAPSRRSAPEPKVDSQQKFWTPETIAEFQANDRRGMYTPEESKALWDDLLLAPAQNRIRHH